MTLSRLRAALLAALLLLPFAAHADISQWSTTPGSNATITDASCGSINFAEGQAPSTLNDSARALMANVRCWYQNGGWTPLGHTTTYVGATQFKVSGTDVTAYYPVGRRVRAVGSTTGTIYGRISASSFSTDTTITVQWDSGSLSNETLTVSVGFVSPTGNPSAADIAGAFNSSKGAAIASAASPSATDIGAATGNLLHITGTNSMGSFGTAPQAGIWRLVIFDGAATLINNSNLVLPCAANITTAAGDVALAVADTTTKWYVPFYMKADGTSACATLNISGLTQETTIDGTNDMVPMYDASEGANNKVAVNDLNRYGYQVTTQTASSSSSLDFTGLSTACSAYKLLLKNIVPATDNTTLYVRFGNGSVDTGNNYGYNTMFAPVGGGVSNTDNSASNDHITVAFGISNGASNGLSGEYTFTMNASGTPIAFFGMGYARYATGPTDSLQLSGGKYSNSSGIDRVRLVQSSGNLSSGSASLACIR